MRWSSFGSMVGWLAYIGRGFQSDMKRPGRAAVVAAIEAGLALDVGRGGVVARALLDAHVDDARILAVDGDADAAVLALGQAVAR